MWNVKQKVSKHVMGRGNKHGSCLFKSNFLPSHWVEMTSGETIGSCHTSGRLCVMLHFKCSELSANNRLGWKQKIIERERHLHHNWWRRSREAKAMCERGGVQFLKHPMCLTCHDHKRGSNCVWLEENRKRFGSHTCKVTEHTQL